MYLTTCWWIFNYFQFFSVMNSVSVFILVYTHIVVWSLSCVQLFCDPMDCSPSRSFVHGISQARILEWVAISSRGSSLPKDQTHVSYIGRWILYHWATREVLYTHICMFILLSPKNTFLETEFLHQAVYTFFEVFNPYLFSLWVYVHTTLNLPDLVSLAFDPSSPKNIASQIIPFALQKPQTKYCSTNQDLRSYSQPDIVRAEAKTLISWPNWLINIWVTTKGLPWWLSVKESACECRRCGFNPLVGTIPWRRK